MQIKDTINKKKNQNNNRIVYNTYLEKQPLFHSKKKNFLEKVNIFII